MGLFFSFFGIPFTFADPSCSYSVYGPPQDSALECKSCGGVCYSTNGGPLLGPLVLGEMCLSVDFSSTVVVLWREVNGGVGQEKQPVREQQRALTQSSRQVC